MNLRPLANNHRLQERANRVIAHGALTNSKRPQSFIQGVYPTHLSDGIGAQVRDADANLYVDYICGLGSILFGHRHQVITDHILSQLNRGTIFSLGTELEVQVAELFQNHFHYLHQMRFLKTSSEACSAAVRIARAFTGKRCILSDGYHGWHDEFTSLTPPANGVAPAFGKSIGKLPTDFTPAMLEIDVAAVIIEPVVTELSESRIDWLRRLRNETEKAGVLLIFDETITGLRFPKLSVAKFTGIDPDLSILGKSIAGGLPLSLVGGRQDVMSADYFVSSTFAGDCLALAAAKAVFEIIKTPGVMEDLQNDANAFCKAFNSLYPELVTIEGYGTRGLFKGDDLTKALFMQECVKAGVLFGPSFFYGTTHKRFDDTALSVCKSVLNRIKNGEVKLEGPAPQKPFAQKVREA